MNAPSPRGACPTLAAPMEVADGLLARFRPTRGFTPSQVEALGRAAEAFGNGRVEITARGSMQVRGLSQETEDGFRGALDAAAIEAKTGVAIEISPIAGEDPEEVRDPVPLAETLGHVCAEALTRGALSPKLSIVLDSGGQVSLSGFKADIRLTAHADGWKMTVGRQAVGTLSEDKAPAAIADVLGQLQALGPRARGSDLGHGDTQRWPKHRSTPHPTSASLRPPSPSRGEGDSVDVAAYEPPSPLEGEGLGVRGAAVLAKNAVFILKLDIKALRLTLPFGQLRGEQLVELAHLMDAHGVAEARPAPERALVLIGADERLSPALFALGFGASGFPLCSGAEAVEGGVIHAADVARAFAGAAADLMDGSVHLHVSTCAKGCAYAGRPGIVLAGNDLAIYRGAAQKPFARLDPGAIEAGLVLLARRIRKGRKPGETMLECLERHDAI